MQPHAQCGEQLLRVDRFCQVVGGAGCHAFLAIAFHGLCREGDDRETAQFHVFADLLHRLVSVHLRHHDVHQHNGNLGRRLEDADGLLAGCGRKHAHFATFQDAAEREDIARVIIDEKNGAAHQVFIGVVQLLEHALLVWRQVTHQPVQEEGRLIEQPFRQFDTLDDHAAGNRVKPGLLFGGKLAAGEHDDGDVGQPLVAAHPLEDLEAAHVGKPQIEHHAIAALVVEYGQGVGAGIRGEDVDVVMCEQLGDAEALGSVVFDDEEAFAPWLAEVPDARDCALQSLGGGGLGNERERAA